MGTTCTALVIREPDAWIAHVGDSRAYLLRAGTLHQLTQDHSLVAQLVQRNQMTEEQARVDPRRNVITRSVGVAETVEIDAFKLDRPLEPGDTLLLCSDGLYGQLTAEELAGAMAVADLGEASQRLITLANEHGGPDNITGVLVRLEPDAAASGAAARAHGADGGARAAPALGRGRGRVLARATQHRGVAPSERRQRDSGDGMPVNKDFGAFELREKIGVGGMASVYLGVQKSLDRQVVLKVLHPHLSDDVALVQRFEREARAAAMLRHENIVQVIDCGRFEDSSYIAMEFVEGLDLKKWIETHGTPPVEMVLLMLRDVCRGIEHAHDHRLVHRDIKPANIMLTTEAPSRSWTSGSPVAARKRRP